MALVYLCGIIRERADPRAFGFILRSQRNDEEANRPPPRRDDQRENTPANDGGSRPRQKPTGTLRAAEATRRLFYAERPIAGIRVPPRGTSPAISGPYPPSAPIIAPPPKAAGEPRTKTSIL